ncbi:hypothetical protein EJ06DRAFT_208760 [Trichodelitschia bisporula]|uniref:Uncharacterized protein n=1 Tax=Trichodelitschia bisporula TaxID=703511 RepID=A0A6G1I8N7_9PEZI|nr:hypothetical protein EJ06DRAFT_208760 [Trichodelitschia bisporula]
MYSSKVPPDGPQADRTDYPSPVRPDGRTRGGEISAEYKQPGIEGSFITSQVRVQPDDHAHPKAATRIRQSSPSAPVLRPPIGPYSTPIPPRNDIPAQSYVPKKSRSSS